MNSPEHILEIMTTGPMAPNAQGLTQAQLIALAESVAARPMGADHAADAPMNGKCESAPSTFPDPGKSATWNEWGRNLTNDRYQTAHDAGMTGADVGRLQLRWAFGFPGGDTAFGQPTVVSGRVFVGNYNGVVYAIDAKTGCHYWTYNARAGVRAAVSIGKSGRAGSGYAAYFGDLKGIAHAVDALTGAPLWQTRVDDQPFTKVTAGPTLGGGKLIVTLASLEEKAGGMASYSCCKFRGKVVAVDPESGKIIWQSYTIPEPAKLTGTSTGVPSYGPAGASVWSSATIDLDKGIVYVGTGNSYSAPAVNSDSVIAFDLATGRMLWASQITKDDVWVSGCGSGQPGTDRCLGPDHDIAGSPILHTEENGKRLILVSQKSGLVHALDPDRHGAIVWEARIGKGSAGGGSMWGSAADETQLYTAIADPPGPDQGGITAIRTATGKIVWRTPSPAVTCLGKAPLGCSRAQRAAVTVIPGAVFSGAQNGSMRAYSTVTGGIIWEFDTRRPFETVNGVAAKGGSLDGPGPTFADGMMFLNSGYGPGAGSVGEPGNVLLAFGLREPQR